MDRSCWLADTSYSFAVSHRDYRVHRHPAFVATLRTAANQVHICHTHNCHGLCGPRVKGQRLIPIKFYPASGNQQLEPADFAIRTDAVCQSWVSISRKPWLGYGFDAFWQGMQGESASVVQAVGWVTLGGAHNGFLELLLDVGILGLAVFAVGYFLLWHRALQLVTRVGGNVPIWLCTYLFFMLIYNFTENSLLAQNSIFWVLYMSIAVNLYLDLPAKSAIGQLFSNASSRPSVGSVTLEQTSCA